mgnify:CR=1 FL=1
MPRSDRAFTNHGVSDVADLTNPKWIYLKGCLFLLILITSVTLILVEGFSWRRALLIGLVAWSAARLYYFMFYVIEKYVDPDFKFAGIGAFVVYLIRRRTDRP